MALALNNLKRVDMPLNKETKPNQTIKPSVTNRMQLKVIFFSRAQLVWIQTPNKNPIALIFIFYEDSLYLGRGFFLDFLDGISAFLGYLMPKSSL